MLVKPVSDEFLIAGDMTLRCIQWGEQGPPVVCIHGLTANAFCFQALADTLAPHHRVFAYDLRGRGDSDKPEEGYSVPIHAEDLAQLIDELGLEKPAIIGHSLGALIALYFAAHYPDRLSKLVLIDGGAPLPWQRVEDTPAWLTASVSRIGTPMSSYKDYLALLKQTPFLGPYWNDYVDLYFQHDVRPEGDGSIVAKAYREGIIEESQRFSEAMPEAQWSNVQVPTLLLRAGQGLFMENDQVLTEASAQAAASNIPNCRFVNYPSLNHYTILFGVEPGPAQEIQTFLASHSIG